MTDSWIAPSILSADFARLGDDVLAVIEAGADLIHFDVMDQHYVPNLTIGPPVCKSLRNWLDRHGIDTGLDVHLMVEPVDELIPMFADAGASIISFHPETSPDVASTLGAIRAAGCKAGLVFNPDVALDRLDSLIDDVDLILLMSVFPGFGGQRFIDSVLPKIEEARARIDASASRPRLEIDGGLTVDNVGEVAARGADTFVAGSTIFGSPDYAATISAMREAIANARNA